MEDLTSVLRDIANELSREQSFIFIYKDYLIFFSGIAVSAFFGYFPKKKEILNLRKDELRDSLSTLKKSRIENVSIIAKMCSDSINHRLIYNAPGPGQYDTALKHLYFYQHELEQFKISISKMNNSFYLFFPLNRSKIKYASSELISRLDADYLSLHRSIEDHFMKFNEVKIQITPTFFESPDLTELSSNLIMLLN